MSSQPEECACTDDDICDACSWEMVSAGAWAESLTLEDWEAIADMDFEWYDDLEE